MRPCHKADICVCVAAAWQPRAALEAKSEHPRRSRREGQPQELPAASIDPTADDSLLCYEQALPGAQGAAAKVCGFRLRVQAPPSAAERAAVGACMTMRSWHGSGGSCAVLAMRDGGGGKNFGCLRPVGGLRRARGVRAGGLGRRAVVKNPSTRSRRHGRPWGLLRCGGGFAARRRREGSSCSPRRKPVPQRAQRYDSLRLTPVDAAVF